MENTRPQHSENNIDTQVLSKGIYSKQAIMGFSVFFTAIFGGVLLVQNLRDLGKKKEANIILTVSIVYTVITIIALNTIESTNSSGAMLFNLIGGVVLSRVLFTAYIPNEEQFQKKKIWKPLIISIIITIPFALALFYSN